MRETKKNASWTKQKIVKLIKSYQNNECLWNFNNENYKSKALRDDAINKICKELNVNKDDVSRKIHNLRNQFNVESKKLERKIEETGESNYVRWEYYESLKFLKDVITPRGGNLTFQKISSIGPKQETITKTDDLMGTNEDSDFPFADDDVCSNAEERKSAERHTNAEHYEIKYNTTAAPVHRSTAQNINRESANSSNERERKIDMSVVAISDVTKSSTQATKDQWDVFGMLIANEFRNLNSEVSKRKLKRRIMQVMVEVGEEDEQLSMGN